MVHYYHPTQMVYFSLTILYIIEKIIYLRENGNQCELPENYPVVGGHLE